MTGGTLLAASGMIFALIAAGLAWTAVWSKDPQRRQNALRVLKVLFKGGRRPGGPGGASA